MQARKAQRQEEYHQHLRVDAAADIALRHANLAHDGKARLILVALGHLLVVDDQHRSGGKYQAQHDPQKQQPAVHAVIIGGFLRQQLNFDCAAQRRHAVQQDGDFQFG